MSTSGATAVGFLILIPIVLVFAVAYGAIKCSEYGGAKWEEVQNWRKTRKSKGHRRKQFESSSGGSSDITGTQESNDVELGKW